MTCCCCVHALFKERSRAKCQDVVLMPDRSQHFETGTSEHKGFEKDPSPEAYWRNVPCPQGGCNTMLHPSRMHVHKAEKHPPTPASIESQRRHQAWMKSNR